MVDLNALPLADLYAEFKKTGLVTRLIEQARDEDLGEDWANNDITSQAFVNDWLKGEARIVARADGVLAGAALIDDVLFAYKADVDVIVPRPDGSKFQKGDTLATLRGNLRAMITSERVILNLLSRLSGVATRTAAFVESARRGGAAGVYDTRKTTPGLRVLEKYAVRCGGGHCHRLGLHDAVLIKDNHIASLAVNGRAVDLAAAVKEAVRRSRLEATVAGLRFVMLEVDTIDQFRAILDGGAAGRTEDKVNIILLDNMNPAQLREAVSIRDTMKVPVELEASGGVTIDTIAAIAASGVDRISTGSLTHGATWIDIAMDIA